MDTGTSTTESVFPNDSSLAKNMTTEVSTVEVHFLEQPEVRLLMISLYLILFTVCFTGNIIILIVIVSHRRMRTRTNFFLANLAIADLFVSVFCVIQNMIQIHWTRFAYWPFGELLCRLYLFTLQLGPCMSAGLLLLMACERFMVICHPMKAKARLTTKLLVSITAALWISTLCISIPYFVTAMHYQFGDHLSVCVREYPPRIDFKLMATASFILWYLVPVVTMTILYTKIGITFSNNNLRSCTHAGSNKSATKTAANSNSCNQTNTVVVTRPVTKRCSLDQITTASNPRIQRTRFSAYTRTQTSPQSLSRRLRSSLKKTVSGISQRDMAHLESRRKVVIMLVTIALFFSVLTLPHHIRQMWVHWDPYSYTHSPSSPMSLFQPLTYLLLFSNSACNPLIYAVFSKRFRTAIADVFLCRIQRAQRRRTAVPSRVYGTDGCSVMEQAAELNIQ